MNGYPIVISLMKANQICTFVDFKCLNIVIIRDPFRIPFTENILEKVVKHDMHLFMDGFLGYNQISIA